MKKLFIFGVLFLLLNVTLIPAGNLWDGRHVENITLSAGYKGKYQDVCDNVSPKGGESYYYNSRHGTVDLTSNLLGLKKGDILRAEWYSPNKKMYEITTKKVDRYCNDYGFLSSLNIYHASRDFKGGLGTWNVRFYLNNKPIGRYRFCIYKEETKHKDCKGMNNQLIQFAD